jgi:hypothetical protein
VREASDDQLGDEHLRALSGAAELYDVQSTFFSVDDGGQRPTFAQWLDVAGCDMLR